MQTSSAMTAALKVAEIILRDGIDTVQFILSPDRTSSPGLTGSTDRPAPS